MSSQNVARAADEKDPSPMDWQSVQREALARMLVIRASQEGILYQPENFRDDVLVHILCQSVEVSPLTLDNVGFKVRMHINDPAAGKLPFQNDFSAAFTKRVVTDLLNDENILELLNRVEKIKKRFNIGHKRAIKKLQKAAQPIIAQHWVDAAKECSFNYLTLLTRTYGHDPLDGIAIPVTPANRAAIYHNTEYAIDLGIRNPHLSGHDLFAIRGYSAHPDLGSSTITLAVTAPDQLSPPDPRQRKRKGLPWLIGLGSWLPTPMPS